MEECGPCPVLASITLAFALQPRKKHGKTSVRVADVSGQPSSPILKGQVFPGPIGCPETSIQDYQSALCKISEERRSHLLRGGSLKSSNVMIDCCLTNTKAKLFFLCAYLEPDNIANYKLSEFNILQRVLCTATAISFNRPARSRNFFLRHCVQAPSGTHPVFSPLGICF